ncbi:diphthamide synthesis protein [Candidatus Woesearchaeota archaeon]|nr:diphthamide synthesis protein [Candidatus Woesearchaeota archaeon]
MKTLFIEARYKKIVMLPKKVVDKLPKKICFFTTVQFMDSVDPIIKQLEKAGKKVITAKSRHSFHDAQILGCGIEPIKQDVDAFLYLGDGNFHPRALLIDNDKPFYCFEPFGGKFFRLDNKEIEKIKKKKKGALLKFLSSDNIGVITTTKPGQNMMRASFAIEDDFPDKRFYYIMFNTIDFSQLENFPFIECFVNTACPRMGYEDIDKVTKPMINIDDIPFPKNSKFKSYWKK